MVKTNMSTDSSENGYDHSLASTIDKLKLQQRLIDISARNLQSRRLTSRDFTSSTSSSTSHVSAARAPSCSGEQPPGQSTIEEDIAFQEKKLLRGLARQLKLKHNCLQQVSKNTEEAEKELDSLINLHLFLTIAGLETWSIKTLLDDGLTLDLLFRMSTKALEETFVRLEISPADTARLLQYIGLLNSYYEKGEKPSSSTHDRLHSLNTSLSFDQASDTSSRMDSISSSGSAFIYSPYPPTAPVTPVTPNSIHPLASPSVFSSLTSISSSTSSPPLSLTGGGGGGYGGSQQINPPPPPPPPSYSSSSLTGGMGIGGGVHVPSLATSPPSSSSSSSPPTAMLSSVAMAVTHVYAPAISASASRSVQQQHQVIPTVAPRLYSTTASLPPTKVEASATVATTRKSVSKFSSATNLQKPAATTTTNAERLHRRYSHSRSKSNPLNVLLSSTNETVGHYTIGPRPRHRSPSPPVGQQQQQQNLSNRSDSQPVMVTHSSCSTSPLAKIRHPQVRKLINVVSSPQIVRSDGGPLPPLPQLSRGGNEGSMSSQLPSPVSTSSMENLMSRKRAHSHYEMPPRSNSMAEHEGVESCCEPNLLMSDATSASMVDLPYSTTMGGGGCGYEQLAGENEDDGIGVGMRLPRYGKSRSVPKLALVEENVPSGSSSQQSSTITSPSTPNSSLPTSPRVLGHMSHAIQHRFCSKTFIPQKPCDYCKKTIRIGLRCKDCKYKCHKHCAPKAPHSCGLPRELMDFFRKQVMITSSSSSSTSTAQQDNRSMMGDGEVTTTAATTPHGPPSLQKSHTSDDLLESRDFVIQDLAKEPKKGQYSPIMRARHFSENGHVFHLSSESSSTSTLEVPSPHNMMPPYCYHGSTSSSPSMSPLSSPSLTPNSPRSPTDASYCYHYPAPPPSYLASQSQSQSQYQQPAQQPYHSLVSNVQSYQHQPAPPLSSLLPHHHHHLHHHHPPPLILMEGEGGEGEGEGGEGEGEVGYSPEEEGRGEYEGGVMSQCGPLPRIISDSVDGDALSGGSEDESYDSVGGTMGKRTAIYGLNVPQEKVLYKSLPDLLLPDQNSIDSSDGYTSEGELEHSKLPPMRGRDSLVRTVSTTDSKASTLVNSMPTEEEEDSESCVGSQGVADDANDSSYRSRPHRISVVDEWNIPYDEIKLLEPMKSESIGEVYKGYWHGDVVIKRFHLQNASHEQLRKFKEEVSILKKTRHENLSLFMGASLTPPNLAIVTSFVKGRTLYRHIHIWSEFFTVEKSIHIAKQIAQAMGYLHARKIVHKDLSSKNIFLDKGKVVITDIGISSLSDSMSLADPRPIRCEIPCEKRFAVIPRTRIYYLAPEIIRKLCVEPEVQDYGEDLYPYSDKTDVYAFGTVLYELITRKFPFTMDPLGYSLDIKSVIYLVGSGKRQEIKSSEVFQRMKDLIWSCWHPDPNWRLPFTTIKDSLSKFSRRKTPISRSPSFPTTLSRSVENLLVL